MQLFPPPAPKVQAIASKIKGKGKEKTLEEIRAEEIAAFKQTTKNQVGLLAIGGLLLLGWSICTCQLYATFYRFRFICFCGVQVIWNVSHSLHTPLMAVTNAISSIIILGAILQIGSPMSW